MVDAALKQVLNAKGNPRLTEKDGYAIVHDWIINLGSPQGLSKEVTEPFYRVRGVLIA